MTPIVPELDAGIEPYELTVVGDEIDEQRTQLADFLDQVDHPDFSESAKKLSDGFRDPELSHAYANTAPFVRQFISVEIDTKSPKGPGIGQTLGDTKPEPRFGSRFRKGLSKPGAREELGRSIERIVLMGFMGELVYGRLNMVPLRTFHKSTVVPTIEKYEEWIKFFPTLANRIFLKSMGLQGGPEGDASAEMYMWAKYLPPYTDFESVCKQFGVKGRLGTTGNREMYAIVSYSAGWILGNLFSEPIE